VWTLITRAGRASCGPKAISRPTATTRIDVAEKYVAFASSPGSNGSNHGLRENVAIIGQKLTNGSKNAQRAPNTHMEYPPPNVMSLTGRGRGERQ